jgi:hypothetical protein
MCDFVKYIKLAQQNYTDFTMILLPSMKIKLLMIFNLVNTLINESFPFSWFSCLNGGENVVYLAFTFLNHKYPIYLSHLGGVEKNNLSLRMPLTIPLAKLKSM